VATIRARRAGEHARGVVRSRARWLLVVLVVAFVADVSAWLAYGWRSPELAGTALVVIGICVFITKFIEPALDRWDRGASGEELVGAVLEKLEDDGWYSIHDVTFGRGNIDHIVIGPGGLFTIETKSHPGQIRVDDVHPRMLRQAYAESKALERVVGRPVVPLLVFSRAYVDRVRMRKGVVVLPARMLAGHLGRRPVVLDPDEVSALHTRLLHALP
jgi:hypothetical protein